MDNTMINSNQNYFSDSNPHFFEHSGISILAYDYNGKLITANEVLLRLTGYKKEEINTFDKWLKLAYPKEIQQKISKIFFAENSVRNFVTPLLCKNGSSLMVVSNITHFKNSEGKIIGKIKFMRNLNEVFQFEDQVYSCISSATKPKKQIEMTDHKVNKQKEKIK